MCIDYSGLNKAYPKDEYPLPRICQIIDSTSSCELLSFLDAFLGYHQISLVIDDEEKLHSLLYLKSSVTQRWCSASRMMELCIRSAFRSSWKLKLEEILRHISMMW
jgi:hypothetical protein